MQASPQQAAEWSDEWDQLTAVETMVMDRMRLKDGLTDKWARFLFEGSPLSTLVSMQRAESLAQQGLVVIEDDHDSPNDAHKRIYTTRRGRPVTNWIAHHLLGL